MFRWVMPTETPPGISTQGSRGTQAQKHQHRVQEAVAPVLYGGKEDRAPVGRGLDQGSGSPRGRGASAPGQGATSQHRDRVQGRGR